jgi:hypothetical protein
MDPQQDLINARAEARAAVVARQEAAANRVLYPGQTQLPPENQNQTELPWMQPQTRPPRGPPQSQIPQVRLIGGKRKRKSRKSRKGRKSRKSRKGRKSRKR